MKLLLVIPYDNLYKHATGYTKLLGYEPLTLSVLAALVPQEYHIDIEIVDEGMEKPAYNNHYDIVGISTVTSASHRAYELAAYFKSKGSYIAIGGHHVTLMPEEGKKHADSIFIGRSEKTWPQFFHDFIKGNPQQVYLQEDDSDELRLPIPRRDLVKKGNYLKQPVIIANYGCRNTCIFCSISKFCNGCSPKRPIADVIGEIKSLNTKEFIFLDPNQYSDKEYSKELYAELAKLKIRWGGLTTHNISDDQEMLKLMVKSGCSGVFIGFETLEEQNLSDMDKTSNSIQKYKDTIRILHEYQLPITGSFMVGLDHDTKESLLALPEKIHELEIDMMRYGIVTPIPNTGFFHKLEQEGRILTKDWSLYDSMHCVFQPKQMTPRELEEIFLKIWKQSYEYKNIFRRLNYTSNLKILKLLTGIGFRRYVRQLNRLYKNRDAHAATSLNQ